MAGEGLSLMDLRVAYADALDQIAELKATLERYENDVSDDPTSNAGGTERDCQVPPEATS